MNNGRICNIPVTEGEVTIVRVENSAEIMKHSCRLAQASRTAGAGVLVVNTGLSKRRYKEAAIGAGIEWPETRNTDSIVSPGKVPLIIHRSVVGELAGELDVVKTVCEEANISVVIITSWEWASSSYRRREQLVFGLLKLLRDLDIAVVIYTQSPGRIKSGEYSRGGVGRLAMMAYNVEMYEPLTAMDDETTDLGVFVGEKKPRPVSGGSAQLGSSKINELPGKFAEEGMKTRGTVKRERDKIEEFAMAA